MRLVESAAKELLRRAGIATPMGYVVNSVEQAVAAFTELSSPVYVKSEVVMGDRHHAGLVVRAESEEEVEAAAARLLRTNEGGARPVLVEEQSRATDTWYAAVLIREETARRYLVLEEGGGTGFVSTERAIVVPVPCSGLEEYEIRNILSTRGVSGPRLRALSEFANRLVRLAQESEAYIVEVNPVHVDERSHVCLAIDAKVELDESGIRLDGSDHFVSDLGTKREIDARMFQLSDHRGTLKYLDLNLDDTWGSDWPLVGTVAVGGGESLVLFDALFDAGLRPTNYCDVSGSPSLEKVAFAVELVATQSLIQGFLLSTCVANQPLSITAAGVTTGLRKAGWSGPLVARIAGNEEAEALGHLAQWAGSSSSACRFLDASADEWEAARALHHLISQTKDV